MIIEWSGFTSHMFLLRYWKTQWQISLFFTWIRSVYFYSFISDQNFAQWSGILCTTLRTAAQKHAATNAVTPLKLHCTCLDKNCTSLHSCHANISESASHRIHSKCSLSKKISFLYGCHLRGGRPLHASHVSQYSKYCFSSFIHILQANFHTMSSGPSVTPFF